MVFKNYEYFLAIVEKGSLTKAAESLFLSQPSLSKYLSRLEANLGVQLFDRNFSPLKLTYAGRHYYEYIKRIQALEKEFKRDLSNIHQGESGEIRIGIAQWRGAMLLPTLTSKLQKIYPRVTIEVLEGRGYQIETALIQNKLDLCLMNTLPQHSPKTVKELIVNEKMLLVGNVNHPVIANALERLPVQPSGYRNIDIHFLENESFIFLKPGQSLTIAVKNLFANHNISPENTWSTENMTTALNMVSVGNAFTIMPEVGARSAFLPHNLICFSIGQPEAIIPFAAVYRKDFVLNQQMHTLVEIVKDIYTKTYP